MTKQEPVAWMFTVLKLDSDTDAVEKRVLFRDFDSGQGVPLYTAPPHREWQSLTHEEKMEILTRSITAPSRIDVAEAMLKEKNNG